MTVTSRNVRDAAADIQQRWETVSRPTYATAAAKAISLSDGRRGVTSGEHGTEWGTVIHLLLETAMRNPGVDLKRLAASALTDQGLASDLAETAVQTVRRVMESAIWQRAMASPQRLVEVPFQTLLAPDKPTKARPPHTASRRHRPGVPGAARLGHRRLQDGPCCRGCDSRSSRALPRSFARTRRCGEN